MIEISEELKKELSNALAAYAWVLNGAMLNCEIPAKFESFKGIEIDDVHRRLQILKDFYNSL